MSVKYWKQLELCRVYVCRSSLPATDVTGELGSLARFLSAVSTRPDMVACSGCPVEFAKTIDQSEYFTQGVQSCFRFEHLSLERLMHKTSYSVFGHIDFFSVLQALMVSLGGSLVEDWVMRHPELVRVSNPMAQFLSFVVLIGKKDGGSESQDLIFKFIWPCGFTGYHHLSARGQDLAHSLPGIVR